MFNKLSRVSLLLVAVIALAACSTARKPGSTLGGGQAASGTQTFGVGRAAGFQGENSPYRLKAPYNQTYHFNFDKSTVHESDLQSIKVQASYLIAHPRAKVRLEGNTDERGSREYNVALGWRRAKAVVRILKEEGVAPAQIVTFSYGEEHPVVFGHTEAAYRANRRVDLIYEAK